MFFPPAVLPRSFVLESPISWETLVTFFCWLLPMPCVTVCSSTGTITTFPHSGILRLCEKRLIIPEMLLKS